MKTSKLKVDMATMSSVQVPCFGQPFELGMVYDCREERPCMNNIYQKGELKDKVEEVPVMKDVIKVFPSDNLGEWASAVGLPDSVKTSFLCGLMKQQDMYRYIWDMAVPSRQARVTLYYKVVKKREQIPTNVYLLNRQYMSPIGTHFVSGLAYGSEAYFIFHRNITEGEKKELVEDEMVTLISKLKQTQEGFTPTLNENEKQDLLHMTCTVHGNVQIGERNLTGMDILNFLSDLKSHGLLTRCLEVPIEVTLRPLQKAGRVMSIDSSLVCKIQAAVLGFKDMIHRSDRLLPECSSKPLYLFRSRIVKFKRLLEDSDSELKNQLREWVPKLRGGDKHYERKLKSLFEQNEGSAFSLRHLYTWMEYTETMVQLFTTCQHGFSADSVQVVDKGGFSRLSKETHKHLIFFSIPMGISPDRYLERLEKCGILTPVSFNSKHSHIPNREGNMSTAKRFAEFAKANQNNTGTNFAVFIRDKDITGCFIREKKEKAARDFNPPLKPRALTIVGVSEGAFNVKWQAEPYGNEEVLSYTVKCRKLHEKSSQISYWETEENVGRLFEKSIKGLEPGTKYEIGVSAICRNEIGETATTVTSEKTSASKSHVGSAETRTKTKVQKSVTEHGIVRDQALIEHMKRDCTVLDTGNITLGQKVYEIPLREISVHRRGYHLGYNVDNATQSMGNHRVIILLGATGSGKSSLVDGIFNHVLGVKWEDNYRFKMAKDSLPPKSQAHRQTKRIMSYTLGYHRDLKVPFGITIVDTPGIGSGDAARDEKLIKEVREFIFNSGYVFDTIHAIGFVVPASQGRLTASQRHMIDSMWSLLGQGTLAHTWLLITFADNQKPPVLHAFEEAGISYTNTPLVFNNSAWFVSNKFTQDARSKQHGDDSSEEEDLHGNFDKIFWKMGKRSLRKLFSALESDDGVRLGGITASPEEQRRLEIVAADLRNQIRFICCDYDRSLHENSILREYISFRDVGRIQSHVYVTKIWKRETRNAATVCLDCKHTCHSPCDVNEKECLAMKDCFCAVCPNKCSSDRHAKETWIFECDIQKQEITVQSVIGRYKSSPKKRLDQISTRCEESCADIKKRALSLMKQYHECLLRLDQIAGRAHTYGAAQMIGILRADELKNQKFGSEVIVYSLGILEADAIKYINKKNML